MSVRWLAAAFSMITIATLLNVVFFVPAVAAVLVTPLFLWLAFGVCWAACDRAPPPADVEGHLKIVPQVYMEV